MLGAGWEPRQRGLGAQPVDEWLHGESSEGGSPDFGLSCLPTRTLLALQGLERAEEGSSSWGPGGQARSLRVSPAGRQDLGVSHCCLSFSFPWQRVALSPPREGCNLVVGKGWFLGSPGSQRAQRAPAGPGILEIGCLMLHRVRC